MQNWAWMPGTLGADPDRPVARPRRPAAAGSAACSSSSARVLIVAMVIFRWTDPFPWPDGDPIMPLAIKERGRGSRGFADIDRAFMAAIVVLGLIAAADVALRWRRMHSERRRGLGWLAIGAFLDDDRRSCRSRCPTSWTDWMPEATTPLFHLGSQLFFPGRPAGRRARPAALGRAPRRQPHARVVDADGAADRRLRAARRAVEPARARRRRQRRSASP